MQRLAGAGAAAMSESTPAESMNRSRNTTEFETTAAACRPYLLRVAMVQLRDRDLAEDVVQETLMAAYGGLERFAGKSTLKTWLTGILKNRIVDALRKRKREAVPATELRAELDLSDVEEFFDPGEGRLWETGPEQWRDPAACWEQKAFFDMVDFCLHRLPPGTARVFMMRELFEMEAREICRELSITQSNLGVLMYRARMALRRCLETNWFSGSAQAK